MIYEFFSTGLQVCCNSCSTQQTPKANNLKQRSEQNLQNSLTPSLSLASVPILCFTLEQNSSKDFPIFIVATFSVFILSSTHS